MANMRCVIEGCGSIGLRHAGLLRELGQDVVFVTRRKDVPYPVYNSVEQVLTKYCPDLYIVATPTANHISSLTRLENLGFSGLALIEKPLGNILEECVAPPAFPTYVAYNMRFHPVIERMKTLLGDEPVVAAKFSVGQYLPDWRPGRDYRTTYSAIRAQGGGVLRDLSHELDLVRFFLGACHEVSARIGTWGTLDIDCEDCVDMLLITEQCPSVNVHLDYLDRNPHRHIVLHTPTRTLSADLWNGMLSVNGETENFNVERNDSFRKQLCNLLEKKFAGLCTWEEGKQIMKIIHAAEKAAKTQVWEKIA